MEAKIVRDNMQKCYRIEGVNHNEKCKDLADRYAQMLRENKVRLLQADLEDVLNSLSCFPLLQVQGYKHIDV